MSLAQTLQIAALVVTGVSTTASAITAVTGTPDPKTLWGKVYKVIETLALVVGKAKDRPPA